MFRNAIVRKPSQSFINGLTSANLGLPNYEKAMAQHDEYITALKKCGLSTKILEADENYPDSTFVEDTALLTKNCAIICNPGAPSRKGEIFSMKNVLKEYYSSVEEIREPGAVEAGDIMMVGDLFYIGVSERTNQTGAEQAINILKKHGLAGSLVEVAKGLHLKSSLAYLENNNLAATKIFSNHHELKSFNIIEIPEEESYAANCIWVNDKVLIPRGFPKSKQKIIDAGYSIIEVNVSEFQKLDGGLSCLSLRF